MPDIIFTKNGEKTSPGDSNIEHIVFTGVIDAVVDRAKHTLSSDDASKITIKISFDSLNQIRLDVSGPAALVNKFCDLSAS